MTDSMASPIVRPTVGQTLQSLGLDADPFLSASQSGDWWFFEVFGLRLYCYNFEWRRRALAFHDLHHVVTDYPCTMKGEMQVATWEFAAGSFPNIFAKLFCLPLVALGAVLIPWKLFAAYRNGTRSKSLFAQQLDSDVTNMSTDSLKAITINQRPRRSLPQDLFGYAGLVALSALMYLLPLIVLLQMFLGWPL
jgi:Coenzyme Q (ubiquinone) biosynthesis protein Coq4